MKQKTAAERNALKTKMAKVFEDEARSLSADYRKIMFDDLVSAFESRLTALVRAQGQSEFLTVIEGEVHVETQ